MNALRLPAEWEEQDGVLIAWPHAGTDWNPILARAQHTFTALITEASHHARVLLAIEDGKEAFRALKNAGAVMERITFCPVSYDDTWIRDYGPITVIERHHPVCLNFKFNGWGGKYKSSLDNSFTTRLKEHGSVGGTHLRSIQLVLEGGSIDSDGQGTLLTTSSCNTHPNRHAHLTPADVERAFQTFLGASRVLWLHQGRLAGDDTDGHVDMLARFAPHDTLLYQSCNDPLDEHFIELSAMAEELRAFRTTAGTPYRMLALPWPSAKHDAEGHRLPASYANFLVLNGAVLVPLYADPQDAHALSVIGQAFPGRKIIGIDCSVLIIHHGSLHCSTMQLPKGVLA